mmetsp:Transcript_13897/g.41710  ORF Transcript_13897/g.41710 Transcript_13897/m.41710 type:complete len:217 (+) Transcript_13897:1425-2075(+)
MHEAHGQGRRAPLVEKRLRGRVHRQERVGRAQDAPAGDVREHDGRPDGRAGPRAVEGDVAQDGAHRRPEARHVGPPEEDGGLRRRPVPAQLRPGDVRRAQGDGRGPRVPDVAGRRRRPLLQRQSHQRHHQDRARERRPARLGREGRPRVDARRVRPNSRGRPRLEEGLWRVHPDGVAQPRRPERRLRDQVQLRERRPGAGEADGPDLQKHDVHLGN